MNAARSAPPVAPAVAPAPPLATGAPRGTARTRILEAASRRFYGEGIRAVSADRLIEEAGVSKVTFYRHFRSKDALVAAYLQAVADAEREAMDDARARLGDDAFAVLRWYAERIGALGCREGFRGCAFLNAAAEYADPAHPARLVVAEHRAWLHGQLRDLTESAGVPAERADQVAAQLQTLRDGAMVAGALEAPRDLADRLTDAGTTLLRAALTPPRR